MPRSITSHAYAELFQVNTHLLVGFEHSPSGFGIAALAVACAASAADFAAAASETPLSACVFTSLTADTKSPFADVVKLPTVPICVVFVPILVVLVSTFPSNSVKSV